MKVIRHFMNTISSRTEAGDMANLQKSVNKMLETIDRQSAEIQELSQAIRQNIKTVGSNQRWSIFITISGLGICLVSVMVRPTPNVATPPSSGVLLDASFSYCHRYCRLQLLELQSF